MNFKHSKICQGSKQSSTHRRRVMCAHQAVSIWLSSRAELAEKPMAFFAYANKFCAEIMIIVVVIVISTITLTALSLSISSLVVLLLCFYYHSCVLNICIYLCGYVFFFILALAYTVSLLFFGRFFHASLLFCFLSVSTSYQRDSVRFFWCRSSFVFFSHFKFIRAYIVLMILYVFFFCFFLSHTQSLSKQRKKTTMRHYNYILLGWTKD